MRTSGTVTNHRLVSVPRAVATGSNVYSHETRLHRFPRPQHPGRILNHFPLLRHMAPWATSAAHLTGIIVSIALPTLPASALRRKHDRNFMKQPPVTLNSRQREAVESAIRETCSIRHWQLWCESVRTNHVHAVVSTNKKPDAILSALKANATRAMREAGVWTSELSPWSFGGSKKYLWDENELSDAIS